MIKEIFVPGRLCLLGEHSDWAATFRRQNSSIEKGYAIIFPTNQGNYAKIKKIEKKVCRFISQNKTKAGFNFCNIEHAQEHCERFGLAS